MPRSTTARGTHGREATRRARPPLTRQRIIQTALRLMDEEGLEAVTMRRIGRELGVEAMSLYNHVSDKEDILAGVVEAVMATFEFPDDEHADWAERARAAAREWRRLLKVHPNVITLMSEQRKPVTDVQALRPSEHALEILRESGLSEDEVVKAFHAFGGYIQGFVMAEVANLFGGEDVRVRPEGVSATMPADEPAMASFDRLYRCDFDEAFEFGLDLMIRGVQAKVAAAARA